MKSRTGLSVLAIAIGRGGPPDGRPQRGLGTYQLADNGQTLKITTHLGSVGKKPPIEFVRVYLIWM